MKEAASKALKFNGVHDIISKKIELITIAVRTSNPTVPYCSLIIAKHVEISAP
jgi:hypothetical protein